MGLTKQYLRYAASAVFGVIGSQKANIAYVTLRGGERGRYVAVAACEHVFVWDIRKGEKVLILQGNKQEVTYLCPSPDGIHIAVGYEDGSIRIFSLLNGESNVTFNGHKAEVTVIKYDHLGARLVSGSKDTDVIVWDVVNECGLYRLKGHKDAITQTLFLKTKNLLVTSSKDTFVKWWDLETQHCFKTMVGHCSEVWGLVLLSDEKRIISGSADSELRAWDINYLQEGKEIGEPEEKKTKGLLGHSEEPEGEVDENPEERILSCQKAGSILREGRNRVVSMATDLNSKILACHGTDSLLEVFRVLSDNEINRIMERKLKKAKKKAKLQAGEDEVEAVVDRSLQDEIQRISSIKASSKIRSFDSFLSPNGDLKVALLLQNNTVEVFVLKTAGKTSECTKTARLTIGGHRTDVRTLAFSSDNIAVLSASAETVKVWNRSTLQVIRTMACEYALCSLFVPGDRQIIIGTKNGKLQIFELSSGILLETVDAHEGALWSISLSPDQRGIVSGGADKMVKFWDFELVKDENSVQNSKRLTVNHKRTLQLDEDVLCVRYSPNQRLLAVSLLDCTVKLFYTDTLKFFLSLYGHKLPVLCLDISHDSALIATGSADRNVKIWGLDFGDCHRSLFAHDDSVMFLQFVQKTHLFFTAGKDKKIKQWDADKFEHIQTLEGHHREVWCLAVSPSGDHIVSSSHDKSLRLWERTREPIILEEEKEMQREAEFEESVGKGDEPVVPGETTGEASLAGKKTIETIKAAERIMEALELYREESKKLEEHKTACEIAGKQLPPPTMSTILIAFGNISPSRYVLAVIRKVKSSELEESLLVLPFSYVPDLLTLFNEYIQNGLEVELICRCLFFLLRIHFGQITSNQMLLTVMDSLRTNTISRVKKIRDVLGFNMAGLQFLQREIESKEDVTFFADATDRFENKKRKRKKRERAILAIA
ncbi:WD repeat-containing protein 3-like [Acipenser ruthenus]|uniref:WD repeat-containing protein 3-like n=1 Tax=Acipenser ruthenus TaxID=7906 RepID=UPI002740C659|nr:WD repeat-containing protein 3-like [Acipenser ruthenus]XP_033863982.2 WD repeat-containing protein 3-like [Acipenser ruthenus]XP_058885943.1 WD repeat-containing protein 3-like [Acipenser ruthenus]